MYGSEYEKKNYNSDYESSYIRNVLFSNRKCSGDPIDNSMQDK